MYPIKKAVLLILAILCALTTYGQAYHGKSKDIQKILKNIKQFSQYYMNAETQKIADCYTTDGKIFPNGTDIIEGIPAIEKRWRLPENVKTLYHKVTPEEIRIVKKYAYDYGYYEGKTQGADGTISTWKGKYVIVWRKVGSDWKIYLDIWNRIDEPKQ